MTAITKNPKAKASTKAEPDAEAKAIATNEANILALANAREEAISREDASADAELAIDAITDEWNAGIETHPAIDLVVANAELVRAKSLAIFAESAVRKADGKIINVSKTLAEIVAPYVASSHPDIQVQASFLNPPKGMSDPNQPVATVVQTVRANSSDGSGDMSGTVDIVFVRKSMHREMDSRKIEDAAIKDGVGLSITSNTRSESDHMVDTLRCVVNSAHAAIPVISVAPSPALARRYASGLAGALAGTTTAPSEKVRMVDGAFVSETASIEATAAKVVKVDLDNGKRTTQIEIILTHSTHGTRRMQNGIDSKLRELLEKEAGVFAPNLGVVTSATVAEIGFPTPLGQSTSTVLITFASQVGI